MRAAAQHVFISYCAEDEVAVRRLNASFKSLGVRTWLAVEDIRRGSSYPAQTHQAIETCAALVVVLSRASNNSPFVGAETELAFSLRKPIYPVRLEDVRPSSNLSLFVRLHQWTDAFGTHSQERLARLARELAGLIGAADERAREDNSLPGTSGTTSAANGNPRRARTRLAAIGLLIVVAAGLVTWIVWPFGNDIAASAQAVAYREVDMFGGDEHFGNVAAEPTSLQIPRDWARAMPASRLTGGLIALAEWRRAENRSQCAPAAFIADAGLAATPYPRAVPGGWGVRLWLHLRDDAAGIAGRPMRAPTDEELRSWFAMAHLPHDGAVGWGPGGQIEMGVIEKWVAHVRIAGQQCTYEIWSTEGEDHLVRLIENLRLVSVE